MLRLALCVALAALGGASALVRAGRPRPAANTYTGPVDLAGDPQNPFASPARVRVLLFVRTDCPITNRYAPELKRLATEFEARGVQFWLVYPDRSESPQTVQKHVSEFQLPGTPLLDPHHQLVRRARATIAPESAVFSSSGALLYHGRIDDLWVDIGKSRAAAQTHDLENAIAAVLVGKPVQHPETRAIGCSLADVE